MTEIHRYCQVVNSKLLGFKAEKHEIQMLSCNGELKADEYWMSAETSWIRDIARGRRDKWWTTSVQGSEGQSVVCWCWFVGQ